MKVDELKEKTIEFLNSKYYGISGKYIIAGVVVIIVLGLIYALTGAPSLVNIKVNVVSNGKYLEGASLQVYDENGNLLKSVTTNLGATLLKLPQKPVTITASKNGCKKTVNITPKANMVISLNLNCSPPKVKSLNCISYAKTITSADILVNKKPGQDCSVIVQDEKTGMIKNIGWRVVGGSHVIMQYQPDNCPTPDYVVKIYCDGASATMPISKFLLAAKTSGSIYLTGAVKPPVKKTNTIKTQNVYVTVTDESGSPISGIRVSAVNQEGYTLNSNYDNVVVTATTDAMGNAILSLPDGQNFYIKAEDPKMNYAPSDIIGPYIANQPLNLNISMSSGFKTTIRVVDNQTNVPLVGAKVEVYEGNLQKTSLPTNFNGTAVFSLKHKKYSAVISYDGYLPKEVAIVGGKYYTVGLEKLTENNSAKISVTVENKLTLNSTIPNIQVQLRDMTGKVLYSGKTDDTGTVSFGLVPQGKYYLVVLPLGTSLSNAYGKTIEVVAGQDKNIIVSISPPSVTLKVYTYLGPGPKPGIDVQVFDITNNPEYPTKIADKTSSYPGIATFQVPLWSKIYLRAVYVDNNGVTWGPSITQPITVNGNMTTTINVSKVGMHLGVEVAGFKRVNGTYYGSAGKRGYLKLSIPLPFYDPSSQTPYDTIDVQLITGGLGTLSDIKATPMPFGSIRYTDLISPSSNIGLKLLESNVITNWDISPGSGTEQESPQPSKYMDIQIRAYKAQMNYNVKIPVYIREIPKDTTTYVWYRAVWRKGNKALSDPQNGGWHKIKFVLGASGSWNSVPASNPYFDAVRGWISQNASGANQITKLNSGTTAYLQIVAIAKANSNNWCIDWSTYPLKVGNTGEVVITPISYVGTLNSSGSVLHLYGTPEQNELCSNVPIHMGDIVKISMKFSINTAGKINLQGNEYINGRFYLFNSENDSVPFELIPEEGGSWKNTGITNLVFKEAAYSYYKNATNGYVGILQNNSFISCYSWIQNKYRPYVIEYLLKNTGTTNITANLKVSSRGAPFELAQNGFYIKVLNQGGISSSVAKQYIGSIYYGQTFNSTSTEKITISPRETKLVLIYGKIGYNPSNPVPISVNINGHEIQELQCGASDFAYAVALSGNTKILDPTTISEGLNAGILQAVGLVNIERANGRTVIPVSTERLFYQSTQQQIEVWYGNNGYPANYPSPGASLLEFESPVSVYSGQLMITSLLDNKLQLTTTIPINGYRVFWWYNGTLAIGEIKINCTNLGVGETRNITAKVWNLTPYDEIVKVKVIKPSNIGWCKLNYPEGSYKVAKDSGITLYFNVTKTTTECNANNGETNNYSKYTVVVGIYNVTKFGIKKEMYNSSKVISVSNCKQYKKPKPTKFNRAIREGEMPSEITNSSCGIENGAAHVCDAEQFTMWLYKVWNSVNSNRVGYSHTYTAALGNEDLTPETINNIYEKMTGKSNNFGVNNTTVGEGTLYVNTSSFNCGLVRLSVTNTHEGVNATVSINRSVSWCNSSSPNFFVGIMNIDNSTRSTGYGVSPVKFSGNNVSYFIKSLLNASDSLGIPKTDLFSYLGEEPFEEIETELTGTASGGWNIQYNEEKNLQCNKPYILNNSLGEYCYSINQTERTVSIELKPSSNDQLNNSRLELAKELMLLWFNNTRSNGGSPLSILSISTIPQTVKPDKEFNVIVNATGSGELNCTLTIYNKTSKANVTTPKTHKRQAVNEQNWIASFSEKGLPAGQYYINATVTNGISTESKTEDLVISQNVPPEITYLKTNTTEISLTSQGVGNESVLLTVNVSDPDNNTLNYNLTVTNSSSWVVYNETGTIPLSDGNTSEGYPIDKTNFTETGVYNITMCVSDAVNPKVCSSTTVDVINNKVIANFTAKDEGVTNQGLELLLDASNTKLPTNCANANYTWTVLNNTYNGAILYPSNTTQNSVTHAFITKYVGVKQVFIKLNVTACGESGTIEKTLTINQPPVTNSNLAISVMRLNPTNMTYGVQMDVNVSFIPIDTMYRSVTYNVTVDGIRVSHGIANNGTLTSTIIGKGNFSYVGSYNISVCVSDVANGQVCDSSTVKVTCSGVVCGNTCETGRGVCCDGTWYNGTSACCNNSNCPSWGVCDTGTHSCLSPNMEANITCNVHHFKIAVNALNSQIPPRCNSSYMWEIFSTSIKTTETSTTGNTGAYLMYHKLATLSGKSNSTIIEYDNQNMTSTQLYIKLNVACADGTTASRGKYVYLGCCSNYNGTDTGVCCDGTWHSNGNCCSNEQCRQGWECENYHCEKEYPYP